MSDSVVYGVWYHTQFNKSLLGVHTDVDTLRELSNKNQDVECRSQRGTKMLLAPGAMTSSTFAYFNGESNYKAWLEIEALPTFPALDQ